MLCKKINGCFIVLPKTALLGSFESHFVIISFAFLISFSRKFINKLIEQVVETGDSRAGVDNCFVLTYALVAVLRVRTPKFFSPV